MASPHQAVLAARYRAAQFLAALKAGLPDWAGRSGNDIPPEDQVMLGAILAAAAQRELFDRMPVNDRRHALAVACTLRQAGYVDPALLQAALLHDAAKSIGQPLLYRVLIVLLAAFWPAALAWLSSGDSVPPGRPVLDPVPGWRRPFVVHARHPALGAAWAAAAGCDPMAVHLIAGHQDKIGREPETSSEKLLAALQWADNLN